MNFPEELKYTKDHEWIRVSGNEATVGITDFAQGELGDIVFIDINTVGQEVAHGALFGTVEAVKTVSDLFMPVSGKVLEINPKHARARDRLARLDDSEEEVVGAKSRGVFSRIFHKK